MTRQQEFSVSVMTAYERYVQDKDCALWRKNKEIYSIDIISLLYAEIEYYDGTIETVLSDGANVTIVRNVET